ncbi:TlyA family RNA methyltransferase [bacterium]|nr:TlyA family RNA methyltransferase [candidate division CSSED10-310 bacterium]
MIRADKFLTDHGIVESRSAAAELIRKGVVRIDGKPVMKPATMVSRTSTVTVDDPEPRPVSRGGYKLEHALDRFGIDCSNLSAMDCGASTGGFTECLLNRGAAIVYAVDVGYGQLHWSLRQDPRVRVMERTNLRTMPAEAIPEPLGLITLDMSFISLKLILEKVRSMLLPEGRIVALIKPQFEAGRDAVGSGGVVRNPATHHRVLEDICRWCLDHEYRVLGITASPITGPKGNREFLFHLQPGFDTFSSQHLQWIEQAMNNE